MLLKSRILKLFLVPKNNNFSSYSRQLKNPLCTKIDSFGIAESPELPSWAKFEPQTETGTQDEDFVVPSLANWIESHRLGDPRRAVNQILVETTESEADKFCKILKENHSSPEDTAKALDNCGLEISNATVEQVLKRFSTDWVPAFGFFTWAKSQTGFDRSPELCNLMVDVLGKCKKFDLMWGLVEEMNESDGMISLDTMALVMRRLARVRKYDEAIETFQGLERFSVKKDISALNILMEALIKENSVESAERVFLELKESIPPNDRTFNVLIHGWCKTRQFEKARDCMKDMDRHGFCPDVYSFTCFIEAHSRDKDFRKVYAVLNEMKERDLKPSIVTFTVVMHGLGKAKQVNEALLIYEKMKESGCVPDTSFYNSMIFILGKAGRLKDSFEVFEDMKSQGLRPNCVTYTTLIACACDHSREETALKLLKQMGEEEEPCETSLETYAPLLKMCCKKKRMRVLDFLVSHMFENRVSIDVGTYSLLVTGLCKSGKIEKALFYFEEMVSKGMVPMESPYRRLVKELEAKGMVQSKEKIENLMSMAKQTKF